MPATANDSLVTRTIALDPKRIKPNPFSLSIYGDPSAEIDDLMPSIREHGILVAMVVAPGPKPGTWEVLSGHRRLACALALGLAEVPCEVRRIPPRRRATAGDPGIQPPAPQDIQSTDARSRRPRRALGIGGESPSAGQPAERPSRDHRIPPTTPNVGIPTLGRSARIPTHRPAKRAAPPARPGPDGCRDRPTPRHGRQGSLPAGPRHLADGPLGRRPGAERRRPARRRDQDDPRRVQGLTPSRPLQRRFPPHAV